MDKCFADNGNKCTILRTKNCKECRFFKIQKQAEESEKKAMNRIESLDTHMRNNIINVYFLGGFR
ncbi:hypothetical protein NE686_19535 [Tissierella carlieri]|uniref:Uncharacterized protein n=1 Tax=Tissierella carlieri TaxID=689904 RepID=A0ABT1SFR6_9FIRM|nr:hypothetical protein [Tissierella carlieri]MCQ4925306.1 hypothetical protein [Tissierella carlieri]